MELTLLEFSLPPARLLWHRLRGSVKVHPIGKHDAVLTDLVRSVREPQPLFLSVGSADFVAPWLERLYTAADDAASKEPQISRLILKSLDYALIDRLEGAQVLPPGFGVKLKTNIATIKAIPGIRRNHVKVEERTWTRLPPFAGFLFGDRLLVGPWAVDDDGFLHVRVNIVETHRRSFARRHERALAYFEPFAPEAESLPRASGCCG